ncbi:MAG: zf-HC2 domain-containing protein [Capsulimonadales bacterium]|nr:zf-HC2 domain-containing protein [Capsulimonadales bacterium]
MSSGNDTNTMRCQVVREALSDHMEGGLPPSLRQSVTGHLKDCDSCAQEEREMAAMLGFLHHRLPKREPVLDIWAEMAPKIAAIQAEERLSIAARLRLRAGKFLGTVAAGAIMFTQALAMTTETRLRKYLLADNLPIGEGEGYR